MPEIQVGLACNDNCYCMELTHRLRDLDHGRLPMLLSALLTGGNGCVSLPSANFCQLLLLVCDLFEKARETCLFCYPLLQLPGTVLGRVSRSTSCVLAPTVCATVAIFAATTCPSSLEWSGSHVGYIYDLDRQVPSNEARVIGFSSNACCSFGVPLCEFRLGAKALFMLAADTVSAARESPMHLSELRAGVSKYRKKRIVRKWLLQLETQLPDAYNWFMDVPKPDSKQLLLSSSFENIEAAYDWIAGANSIHRWISGSKSVESWTAEYEEARMRMIEAARSCKAPVMQRVLDLACLVPQRIADDGHWVYVLASPLWGKCYVGGCGYKGPRCPLLRWAEHIRQAILWSSKTSRKRFASSTPPHYAAMASVSVCNVVMFILARPNRSSLAEAERYFIRKLYPVFNSKDVQDSPWSIVRHTAPLLFDDIVLSANRILRRSHPRLSAVQWSSLIADVAAAGERTLAAKLARHARATCAKLKKIRAFPQVSIPCALPRRLMSQMQSALIQLLQSTPGFARTPQFGIMLRVGRVCWKRSPMLESVIAPAVLKGASDVFDCKCGNLSSSRVDGHICTRKWQELSVCNELFQAVGNRCMLYRLYPSLESVCGEIEHRVMANLRLGGMDKDLAADVSSRFVKSAKPPMQEFWKALSPHLHLDNAKSHLRTIKKAGLTFVRIDRNPGRVILLCNALWLSIQRKVFLQNDRYKAAEALLASDDEGYIARTIAEFLKFVQERGGGKLFLRKPPEATRPRGYWTIKQKSLLSQVPPVLKFRPIIAHNAHPCRAVLRKIGRALSLLVSLAVGAVRERHPQHMPIWKMHRGMQHFLQLLRSKKISAMAEFDVEDCFLNTPRALVIPALQFWLAFCFHGRRGTQYFAISKDGKSEDHIGRPCSLHYWEISSSAVLAVVEWELSHNSLFEVVGENGQFTVLQQDKGLPIGGHLSAALVELVALYREYTVQWPITLNDKFSMRYRDNFFVDMPLLDDAFSMQSIAADLSVLLSMPIKPVSVDASIRCLETRLVFSADKPVRCLLAFRTDADRQGESGDVSSWPMPDDPRTPLLLPGLLAGLAAKLRFYTAANVGGYTATVRRMYAFVRQRGYPRKLWMRPFALALLRCGVPVPCLPRLLRRVIKAPLLSHNDQQKKCKRES